MRKTLGVALAAGLILGSSFLTARAETVTFSGIASDTAGTGFGNVLNLLTVQNEPDEFGSILWSGAADVATGNASQPPSRTWSVAELAAQGIVEGDTLGLVFNINESGQTKNLVLGDFIVRFQDGSGATLFDAPFDAAAAALEFPALADGDKLRLANVESGTGTAGWLFNINLSTTDAATFFGDPDNRIGMLIEESDKITESDDGPDNFYLAEITGEPTPLPIPAPSTLVGLLSMGAVGLVAVARRRRKAK